ncbi:MAG: amino acid adenylation domain-containing protein, partial [Synergistaceae bacterium]|nr:amino acid adenylation domain-containing protein [Synergistaceae bacterium]
FYNLVSHDGADFAGLYSEYKIKPDYFFVYQGEMLSGVTIKGRYIPIELYDSEEAMTSLTLHVFKQNTGDYRLRFEYSAGLFSEDTVKRIAEIYIQIITGLCSDDELQNIRLVNDRTLTEMDSFNRTEADFPVTDIVSMFREAVKKYPDNKAVIFGDETLTYREADDISERIACYISSMNIGKGEVVSILIPRCNYMVTASLGVLKSGAAYQPLDSTYPAERLNFMMKDADCRLLIADEALLEKVSDYKGPVLLTKDIPGLKDSGKLEKNPSPEDLFILLYTSGSTGTPKGVMLEHGSIANFCCWYRNYYNLDENSRVAAYASYGFDANMMDMYPALTNGACVCIIDEEMRLDLMAMEEWFNKLNITHSFITTQVGRQFYTTANTTSLTYLSVGGEKLVPVQPLDKADKKPVLYNGYGPTECTIFSTITPVNRMYDRVPIGVPLSNYKCYVVDSNMRRLPPLVPGELLISGRGVGRGYLNRPDLTQKVFIANPFSSEKDYIRAYRTGDIVRLLPDGKIDFIGRNDGQVKVRGFRVELSEIEAVIREFPGIKDATVAAFDNPAGGKFIAAYVVSHDSIDKDALRKFIGERKPPYMIPSAFMQIDKIPLN